MSYIVGICGGSGSGKTTLSELLLERLRAAGTTASLISFDNYYKHTPGMTPEQRAAYNFDEPAALDGHLLARDLLLLKDGQPAFVPEYDFSTQTRRPEPLRVDPADVILVEGILIYAVPEVRQALDLSLYVDAPADVRSLRRFVRDIEERGHTPQSAAALYLNTAREAHDRYVEPHKATSDLIIPNVFKEATLNLLVTGIIANAR
ncbi:MAG: uridine kinase [Coriobacteriia bacterium]|nr:uridine kinase [Coriobacteriia bacterium]